MNFERILDAVGMVTHTLTELADELDGVDKKVRKRVRNLARRVTQLEAHDLDVAIRMTRLEDSWDSSGINNLRNIEKQIGELKQKLDVIAPVGEVVNG